MKKFFTSLVFLICVGAFAGAIYFAVMKIEAGYVEKMIFSGAIIIIAIIAAALGASASKNRHNELIAEAVDGLDEGIAVYLNDRAVYKSKRFVELETKAGKEIIKIIAENNECEALYIRTSQTMIKNKPYLYVTVSEKSAFFMPPKQEEEDEKTEE